MEFGKKLRVLLDKEGVSGRAFAEKIDVNPTHISKVLNGHRAPNYELLEKILEEFSQVDLNWLMREHYTDADPIRVVSEDLHLYSQEITEDLDKIESILKKVREKVSQK